MMPKTYSPDLELPPESFLDQHTQTLFKHSEKLIDESRSLLLKCHAETAHFNSLQEQSKELIDRCTALRRRRLLPDRSPDGATHKR